MQPTIGRIVHYVLPSGPSAGEHRPLLIVRVWTTGAPSDGHVIQGRLFSDSDLMGRYNDQIPHDEEWKTSVKQDEETKAPGTWHWPEREGAS